MVNGIIRCYFGLHVNAIQLLGNLVFLVFLLQSIENLDHSFTVRFHRQSQGLFIFSK